MKFIACITVAAMAAGALAQTTQPMLFVCNNASGTIAAFLRNPDGTLTLSNTYGAGANPQDLGVSPDGRHLVVVNATSQTTEEIYTFGIAPDGTLIPYGVTATIGDGPLALDFTSDGTILIPSATDDNLSAFRMAGNTTVLTSTAPAGGFPTKVVSTPDGRTAFTSTSQGGGSAVYSFGVSSTGVLTPYGAPAATIPSGSMQGMAVHPNGQILYGSSALANEIYYWQVGASGLLTPLGNRNAGGNSCVELAVHPAGTWLYVCNVVSDTLTVLPILPDGSLGPMQYTYTIGNDIRDVVTDGRYVYVTDESTLGSSPVGIIAYRIEANGSLTMNGPIAATGGTRPQRMALWSPVARVSGAVDLEDWDAAVEGRSVTFELWQGSTVVETHVVAIGPGGEYGLAFERFGAYDLSAKASHWLRQKRFSVILDPDGGTGLDFSLANGDVDGDNEVAIGDYSLLSLAFGSSPGDATWNPEADLNGDETVDIGDFSILSANFGRIGDE